MVATKRRSMERRAGDGQRTERPVRAKTSAGATGDIPKARKSRSGRTASIRRAISKVRAARLLVCGDEDYKLWGLLYDAEEHMMRAINGEGA